MITVIVPLDSRGRCLGFAMRLCSILLAAWVVIACGCRRNASIDVMGGAIVTKITLTSTAYIDGQAIPPRFTGEGADVSPALSWGDVPAGTKGLALLMDDPDAPSSEPWVHWVMYRIPAKTRGLPENAGTAATAVGVEGKNSFGKAQYNGPMPPKGHGCITITCACVPWTKP
jgi:Raf kinase inhibitor-like YbhB/YbcL family protein